MISGFKIVGKRGSKYFDPAKTNIRDQIKDKEVLPKNFEQNLFIQETKEP